MTTTEIELMAHDALNPGFGYALRIMINGREANRFDVSQGTARRIMRQAVETAREANAAEVTPA